MAPKLDWNARKRKHESDRQELHDLCRKHGLPLPWGPYRAAPHTCFNCGKRIVVYTWVGHHPHGSDRPPAPRPPTLQERTTDESGGIRYWVNTCLHPRCGVPQGDHYLYEESNDSSFRWTWQHLSGMQLPGGPVQEKSPPSSSSQSSSLIRAFLRATNRRYRG